MNIHDFQFLIFLGTLLFMIGVTGVIVRRNPLVIFMSIELMLNSVNLVLVSFGRMMNSVEGQIFAFMVIVVAAAEVVVGLAMVTRYFRAHTTLNVDDMNELRD